MCNLPNLSDFENNAKQWDNLDDLRSIACYRGFTAEQVQHAIDAVGPHAPLVAEFLHIKLMTAALDALKAGQVRR
jgi:hypothetical protein